ncbi:hypothetical protein F7725_011034, partial [Dissostichus mawsoni]
PGCKGAWDSIACWERTEVGQTFTIPCPRVLKTVFGRNGNISRNCTSAGWSEVFPNIYSVCGSDTSQDKTLYTLGHSLSLIALTTGSAILCLFRAVPPHAARRHLLREQTLHRLHVHRLGFPLVFVFAWVMTRIYLEDTGCWERNDNPVPNWVINGPIGLSIMVNFILFISIIRILVQKLRRLAKSTLLLIPLFGIHYVVFVCFGGSIAEDYKIFFDLALGSFQVLYDIFVNAITTCYYNKHLPNEWKCLYFIKEGPCKKHFYLNVSLTFYRHIYKHAHHLGLVVAILYCFLNSEVQGELKRKWRSMCLNCRLNRDHFSNTFASRNGSEH